MTETTVRKKLTLKPHERLKAIERGQLEPTAQKAAGGPIAPSQVVSPVSTPDRRACEAPAPSAPVPQKLPLLEQVKVDLGVDWLAIPFALGVGKDRPPEVRKRIGHFVRRPRYLRALVNSEHRFNLDGSIAGPVAPEHRAAAKSLLEDYAAREAAITNAPKKAHMKGERE